MSDKTAVWQGEVLSGLDQLSGLDKIHILFIYWIGSVELVDRISGVNG